MRSALQILAMIGEEFHEPDEICGAVISIRPRKNRLALWTKTATKEETQKKIGQTFKRAMELPSGSKVAYQVRFVSSPSLLAFIPDCT